MRADASVSFAWWRYCTARVFRDFESFRTSILLPTGSSCFQQSLPAATVCNMTISWSAKKLITNDFWHVTPVRVARSFFGWSDVAGISAQELAVVFIERFPAMARSTNYFDYAYAGWFATLLAQCEYGYLPYLYSEDEPETGALHFCKISRDETRIASDRFPAAAESH